MAGQVSPAVCCTVGSQLQFFRIRLLLQKFFKAIVKVSMCSCAVLNQVFAAQLGSRAGALLGMFTLAQQMWLPNAQKVSDSCHRKVFWHPSSLHPWVKSHFMQSWCRAEVNPRHCFCLGPWLTVHPLRDDAGNSSVICRILWCKAMERQSAKESFTPENVHLRTLMYIFCTLRPKWGYDPLTLQLSDFAYNGKMNHKGFSLNKKKFILTALL